MKHQISLSELDTIIRKNIKERGLNDEISEDKIQEIKKKIRQRLGVASYGIPFPHPYIMNMDGNDDGSGGLADGGGGDGGGGAMEEQAPPMEDETLNVNASAEPAVSHSTVVDPESIEVAKKEGALEAREQELQQREAMLNQKEKELAYNPQLPDSITKADPAKLFIYDKTELSLGAESLTRMPYHMIDAPDEKKSMQDIWLQEGKVRAEVFQVEFKKIGDMVFDPFQGICRFVEMTQPLPNDLPAEEFDSVQQAINSQMPTEPMIDAVEPVMDVTLPASTDMGLQGADVQKSIEGVVEKILRNYFTEKNNSNINA